MAFASLHLPAFDAVVRYVPEKTPADLLTDTYLSSGLDAALTPFKCGATTRHDSEESRRHPLTDTCTASASA